MSFDLCNTSYNLSKSEILDMKNRVDTYKSQGGTISNERAIYIDYVTQREYVTYERYQTIISRFEYLKEPDLLQIYFEPINISDDDKILPIATVLDMELRVNQYTVNGATIDDNRRIYLNMGELYEYITYAKYKEVMTRVLAFREKNGRNPNYVYLRVVTNDNNTTRPDAVGDDISPNGDGWYLMQRYSTTPSKIKQETNYWCADNAMQQLIYELTGEWYSESYLAKIAGTTTQGTGHDGINKALKTVFEKEGINASISWEYLSDIGYEQLGKYIKSLKVGTLQHVKYKKKYGHYEHIVGVNLKTGKVLVQNSLSGGWMEYRTITTNNSYANLITQKTICKVTIP